MAEQIRIDHLNPAGAPSGQHLVPAMKDGVTAFLTVDQILGLLVDGAPGQLDTLNELAAALGDNANFAAAMTAALAAKADTSAVTAAIAAAVGPKQDAAPLVFGQCRLFLDGANIRLIRDKGRLLTINGAHYVIPAAGVALAATGLTPSSLYYIYAYINAGNLALEASATGHSIDAATGVEIKTGDATRTLLGMVRPVAGPAFADSPTQRFVRSWFNRSTARLKNEFSTGRSTTSITSVEINSEIRCEFLSWLNDLTRAAFTSSCSVSGAGVRQGSSICFDGIYSLGVELVPSDTGAHVVAVNTNAELSEGYHYATIYGVTSSGTSNWRTGTSLASAPSLTVTVGN
ncbi:hypothetical protein ASC97_04330 [Rhizobium sp. Root1203]|uniref:hypothetical protein n=1 Tax=Rhizobium sp. Root1203 TaxID=1736427 RepID=UPI00070B7F74|nr:hypothetical protein [Rhizobium sp. Root1203]KQV27610.1 hypothetical protein ASC97_04330 [Rhizobium sp. Root1203]